ncbi:O-linked N-acetylglucosamine transferase, SPINDLY family protein [Paucidesulfovibrio longus]|uniref:O-linked N-acetylglucosamine transferase, SPINDLY family protein n=1 Tax=Paucidesulfovibrio longus TaxID=889 RepID=UPI0003B3897C|nr:tetratricopeptide repeat protein [Paucidesulfovibrio longus]
MREAGGSEVRELLERAAAEHRLDRLDQARLLCRKALELEPDQPDALRLLGAVALQSGRHRRAETLLRRAVELLPENAQVRLHLGMALEGCGRLGEAVEAYKACMALDPDAAEPYARFGNLLKDNGQLREALACYAGALRRDPDHFASLVNMGGVLLELGRGRDAVDISRRAAELRPLAVRAHLHLGAALHDAWRTTEAESAYLAALELEPGHSGAMNNLGVLKRDQGRIRDAVSWFRKAWKADPDFAAARSNYLLTRHYLADEQRETFLEEALAFGHDLADPLTSRARSHDNDPDPDRPLRVGYLSGDLRRHAVSSFLVPLLAEHNPENVEFYCYANNPYSDGTTDHLRSICSLWRNIRTTGDIEASEIMREDKIDILVDLSGHSSHNRLLTTARKPAPVQALWLGYFDTTGMRAVDWIIADRHVCPEEQGKFYSEGVWRLPVSFWCYGPPDVEVEPVETPFFERKSITFGCFNNTAKINNTVVDAWAAILRQVPESELLLQSGSFADKDVRARYQSMFSDRGVGDRVAFRPHMELRGYLASYQEVDLALDPFPYGGGATTADALWMGVPVVSLRGGRFSGRLSTSLLEAAGLGELATRTLDDYIACAVGLAREPERLALLRSDLRGRLLASPLCDAKRFARDMEAAYRGMWSRWCGTSRRH